MRSITTLDLQYVPIDFMGSKVKHSICMDIQVF